MKIGRLQTKVYILYQSPSKIIVKFIYSEKATEFFEISTLLLTVTKKDKSKVEISQIFVAFSEYMNFTYRVSHMYLNDFMGLFKGHWVVLDMSTVCRFTPIAVKEFHHKCQW